MQTLCALFDQSVSRFGSLPAVKSGDTDTAAWSYAELADAAGRVAGYLSERGVTAGDRVILWGPNSPEWVAAFFGAQIIGAVVVPIDLRSREDFLQRIAEQTEPAHYVIGSEQRKSLTSPPADHTVFEELMDRSRSSEPLSLAESPVKPDDIAELVFTSGTTGAPKGVILTHRNITTNVEMARYTLPPTPDLRLLSLLPLSHMFEQTIGLMTPLSGGSSITYIWSLRPDVIFKVISAERITLILCVPQVLQLFRSGIEREIARQGRERPFGIMHGVARILPMGARRRLFRTLHARFGGQLDSFLVGGAYLDPDLARWWEQLGVKVIQGYGMTEASPMVTANRPDDRDPESVGRVLPGVELKVSDEGEILVQGPNVTSGYWKNPEATEASFVDGWYRTGDLGTVDRNGRVHLRGRLKNMIVLANGMKVHPEDIEPLLTRDPRVEEAVIIGLGDDQDPEVHAVLKLAEQDVDTNDILRLANADLAPHQRIRGATIWPDDEFPMTHTLKIKRADVKSRITALQSDVAVGAPAG